MIRRRENVFSCCGVFKINWWHVQPLFDDSLVFRHWGIFTVGIPNHKKEISLRSTNQRPGS
jgi:hypothetical protein